MKNEKITVYLNGRSRTVYRGMRVKNVMSVQRARAVRAHRAEIQDAEGNRIDIDGALFDGQRLFIRRIDPAAFADKVLKRADAAFKKD